MNSYFNYQIVFKLNSDSNVIFAGVTKKTFHLIYNECVSKLAESCKTLDVLSFVYQPVNNSCDEQTKKQ